MKRILYIVMLLLCFSCQSEWKVEQKAVPTIVVEGWIETGKPATVILTRLLPFVVESGAEEEYDLKDLPLRWATVKISDGENEEILVGMYDENYVPPYVYAGSDILGEEGRTYTLSVKYPGIEVTAQTTMPSRVRIERTELEQNPSDSEQYSIRVHFKDDAHSRNYYKLFTRIKGQDTRFHPSFMGNAADDVFPDGKGNMLVNRAFTHIGGGQDSYSPYFRKEDTVRVKLAQLPKDGYDFWYSYEDDITNAANVLFPSSWGLKSNIHGGRGIWCAYAVDIVDVICEP